MLIHINDRSKLDEIISYNPKTKQSKTRLQELQENQWIPRTDIVLINMTNTGKEYTLHVTSKGYSGDTWILDIVDERQFNEICRIAEQMRLNALNYECASKLLQEY